MCWFFSITTIVAVFALVTPASAQDWRTSGEDPCSCTDSMPFIIGPRPPVTTPEQIASVVRDSADSSCRVARLAIEALRNAHHDRRATDALVTQLGSPHCSLRASAAWSLMRHQGTTIAPALLRAVDDPDRRVRQAVAAALGTHGGAAAVPPLARLLEDPSKHVRQAAAEALGRIGDAAARGPLSRLLDDTEPHVRQAATEALRRLR